MVRIVVSFKKVLRVYMYVLYAASSLYNIGCTIYCGIGTGFVIVILWREKNRGLSNSFIVCHY